MVYRHSLHREVDDDNHVSNEAVLLAEDPFEEEAGEDEAEEYGGVEDGLAVFEDAGDALDLEGVGDLIDLGESEDGATGLLGEVLKDGEVYGGLVVFEVGEFNGEFQCGGADGLLGINVAGPDLDEVRTGVGDGEGDVEGGGISFADGERDGEGLGPLPSAVPLVDSTSPCISVETGVFVGWGFRNGP